MILIAFRLCIGTWDVLCMEEHGQFQISYWYSDTLRCPEVAYKTFTYKRPSVIITDWMTTRTTVVFYAPLRARVFCLVLRLLSIGYYRPEDSGAKCWLEFLKEMSSMRFDC